MEQIISILSLIAIIPSTIVLVLSVDAELVNRFYEFDEN